MQRRLQFLLLLIPLILLSAQMTGQGQFLAEIITQDAEFCETGEVTIEIKFGDTFAAPFNAFINITFEGGTNSEYFVENFHPSNNNNNYTFSKTKAFDKDIYGYGEIIISIKEARDANTNYSTDNIAGSATVTLFKTPSSPFTAGEDIATCGLSTLLNATPGTESDNYYWQAVTGASFSDASIANPLFTAEEDGPFELTFTQTNGACSISDEVSVALYGQPSATISSNSEICGTGAAEIDFELQGYGPWKVAYNHGAESDQFTTSNNFHTQTHTITGETSFQLLTVTDVNDCSTTFADEPGTTATVTDLLPTANAGNDRAVCGDAITLSADDPSFGTGTWSGGGSFSNNNDNKSLFQSDPFEGEVTRVLTWTVKNKECTAIDDVAVTFYEQLETADISAGKDTLLYQQKSFILEAMPPPFGEGTWTITSGNALITEINKPKAEVTQLDYGPTILRWTVTNGVCQPVWQETEIRVQSIQHPTGFSPNGDGKNDQLEIPGAKTIENNQLIVFNQQGTVVYKTSNYQNDWKGTKQNGEKLPDGYYYYVFSGEGVNIKDYLIIKRSIR